MNQIGYVVMEFYDVDLIWTYKENDEVEKYTDKVTHTWKKFDDTWLIPGGMGAAKN